MTEFSVWNLKFGYMFVKDVQNWAKGILQSGLLDCRLCCCLDMFTKRLRNIQSVCQHLVSYPMRFGVYIKSKTFVTAVDKFVFIAGISESVSK